MQGGGQAAFAAGRGGFSACARCDERKLLERWAKARGINLPET